MDKKSNFSAYLELTKPRILSLILVTTAFGFFMGSRMQEAMNWSLFLFTLIGAGLVCAGASTLNHYLERDVDRKMVRTRNRPIPSGLISPANALSYGILLILLGITTLYWKVNLLTAFLSLLTAFLYVLVYTPMKKFTWLNTSIGAIPGALPPLGGWTAATNHLGLEAWVLFGILFAWQHPHFYAIAWMLKEDYQKGGLKMLPVLEPDGRRTFQQIEIFSLILLFLSIVPVVLGSSGVLYFWGVLLAGILFYCLSRSLTISKSIADARRLLQASVIYLPLLFLLILIDGMV